MDSPSNATSQGIQYSAVMGKQLWRLISGNSLKVGVSRTQTLITHISRLCQEIHDIKKQNKNKLNSTLKAEPREGTMLTKLQEKTMDSNQCQDRTSIDGMDGSNCTYSSRSTLPPHSEHNHDIPSHHETSHPSDRKSVV